jgi:chromate reductase, NAD(P)H dehydrogenase (quinone)
MRILGLSGSLREDSHNTRLLHAAADLAPAGTRLLTFAGLGAIPPFSEDVEHIAPPAVLALRDAVAAADGVLLATPEYNGSFPGQLKNALDWLSRPAGGHALRGVPVAVVGASAGVFGAVWAQADLRRVLGRMGAVVDERELAVGSAHEAFDARGALRDPRHAEQLAAMVAGLAAAGLEAAA